MRRIRVLALPLVGSTALGPEAAHHLIHVLKTPPGTAVIVFDGHGREQDAELTPDAHLTPTSSMRTVASSATVQLVLAVLKHQAMDLAIRMATEAGALTIRPVSCQRTVAKGDRTERWQRIVRSAAQQCGRNTEPQLFEVQTLQQCLSDLSVPLYLASPGATRARPVPGICAVAIGPEGGFSPEELALFNRHEATPISLGPHVLRASTAAPVAVAALTAPVSPSRDP